MKAWLLLSVDNSDRVYQGNLGYDDEVHRVYRYDDAVPNSKSVREGDIVLIRDRTHVHGSATIESTQEAIGNKIRQRCPKCRRTDIKARKTTTPRYRCPCGWQFDEPLTTTSTVTLFSAWFGNSFVPFQDRVEVRQVWSFAIDLNKQFSIQPLDVAETQSFLIESTLPALAGSELPVAATTGREGAFQTVSVDRFERDPRLRNACIEHYGCRCVVCGFDFSVAYGQLGDGFIEVHHLEPLGGSRCEREVDAIRDLRPLCSNCHSMIHRRCPPLKIKQLKRHIRS